MESVHEYIVGALKSGLTGTSYALPPADKIEPLVKLAARHHIDSIVYQALFLGGCPPTDEWMGKLFLRVARSISVSETQMAEIEKVCKSFRENGIDYMPLKGAMLRRLYPSPDMRQMGDADILIRLEQYEKIPPLMEELGFTFKGESDHECIWVKPDGLYLELHKRLIPSYNTDYYAYFGDGWQRAVPVEGTPHTYRLPPVEEYVYLFTHFAKHYRDGGVGLKHVADLWLYRQANLALDESAVAEELEKLGLSAFHRHFCDLLQVWFHEGVPTEQTRLMTRFICDSGAFGTRESRVTAEGLREARSGSEAQQVRSRKLRQALFPSRQVLAESWPILQKAPVLLPFVWVTRGLRAVFFRRKGMLARLENVHSMTADRIETYGEALRFVGLDFHLTEEEA